ncbi:ABC transporter permease [Paenibacillus albus]|uniref:Sugar ABC transporter permease n=1 Tax=Paenibacillus albus TaxID=2495582 RepID=A0A3Q8X8P8_9BACL|nr:ABC transporter permease subunit [Paenibacillus albus]AZN43101.1 sugar ABC transporter permease [Paenibacillus albus]
MRNKAFITNYYLMLIPGMILLVMFSFVPLFGIAIAFENFNAGLGIWRSEWVGLDNFTYMFQLSDSRVIFMNTIYLAVMKIIANLIVPLIFALLLNEVRKMAFKRFVQTIVYLPHFLSWVILAGIVTDMFSYHGIVNQFFGVFGFKPVLFLASNTWFPGILVGSDVWKEFGFNTIIYLAALTGINPSLYEAAAIDGAGRAKQLWHVTLPGIKPTIVLLATLSLGNVLNAGFDQIYNMYNPLVYSSSDIIDTYVYRVGLLNVQYGLATAVGLLKSVVSLLLIGVSYTLASKFANYRIF